MPERWRILESRVESLTGPFRLRRDRAILSSSGVTHEFLLLQSPDWVNVVPVTEGGEIVMVRQHRLGTDMLELEIPGGLIDAEDGSPLAAAQRELLEETGLRAERWRLIGTVAPNPALLNNLCYTYLAEGCRHVDEPQPDATESLDVVELTWLEIQDLVQTGEIRHALVISALFWYDLDSRKSG
jgi:ADP-ribose pyrophosphatase